MFYRILAGIIGEVLLTTEKAESELPGKLQQCYWNMEEEQQKECLRGLLEFTENDIKLYIFMLSYLLQLLNDGKIVEQIEETLLADNELSLTDRIYILYQLRIYVFSHELGVKELENSQKFRTVYSKQVESVSSALNQDIAYIPYANRNKKRIVMLIEPLLGGGHAPTRKAVNLYHYLTELGYEVYMYATNYKRLQTQKLTEWWEARCSNALFDENTEFCLNYYGVDIKGFYVMYTEENYINMIRAIREEIREYNPAFVLTMGDSNVLADTCNQFTTVVTMGCTSSAPVTQAPIIARYFTLTEKMQKEYQRYLKKNQRVIEFIYGEVLEAIEENNCTREGLKIKEEDFLIVIAGNRLDNEMTEDMLEILYTILEREPNCKVLFIGECSNLQKRLEKEPYADRLRFMGYVKNFKAAIAMGDLFLNPPRRGGGTGALYAVESQVPVLTLGNCDVANMGEQFVCERLEDMPIIVHQYITDALFMEQQKRYCRERTTRIDAMDNIGLTRAFCGEVEDTIREIEANTLM